MPLDQGGQRGPIVFVLALEVGFIEPFLTQQVLLGRSEQPQHMHTGALSLTNQVCTTNQVTPLVITTSFQYTTITAVQF